MRIGPQQQRRNRAHRKLARFLESNILDKFKEDGFRAQVREYIEQNLENNVSLAALVRFELRREHLRSGIVSLTGSSRPPLTEGAAF